MTRFLLAFCGVAAILWFLLSAQTNRYLLPILPVLSLAAAGTIIGIQRWARRIGTVTGIAVGVELALGMAVCVILIGPQALPVFNLETDKEFLSRTLNIYPIYDQVNSQLPKDAKIMLLHDTRGFYLDREYLWGIGHHNLIQSKEVATPESLAAAFRRLGVTHLLLSPDVRRSLTASQDPLQKSLQGLISQGELNSVLEDAKRGFIVFALNPD